MKRKVTQVLGPPRPPASSPASGGSGGGGGWGRCSGGGGCAAARAGVSARQGLPGGKRPRRRRAPVQATHPRGLRTERTARWAAGRLGLAFSQKLVSAQPTPTRLRRYARPGAYLRSFLSSSPRPTHPLSELRLLPASSFAAPLPSSKSCLSCNLPLAKLNATPAFDSTVFSPYPHLSSIQIPPLFSSSTPLV